MVFTFSYYNELTNHSASQMNDIWGRDRVYYKSFNQWIFYQWIFMLFADDMVILEKGINDLQNSLELLERYCDRWGLQVNTEKTKNCSF